ncbi:MAG: S8 family serine peptidase, partial [Chloroflexi bacterium]|nr:S8 family serine peptidase [Chloroflexota bacterium]
MQRYRTRGSSGRRWGIVVSLWVCLLLSSLQVAADSPSPDPSVVAAPTRLTSGLPITDSLRELLVSYRGRGLAGAQEYSARRGLELEPGKGVRVVIHLAPGLSAGQARAPLEKLGVEIEAEYADMFQCLVPLERLETLARAAAVRWVRPPLRPLPAVTSQGVALLNADAWQAAGYTGAGVKIAVVDLGFQGYASLLGSELPGGLIAYSARADGDIEAGERHGTGCAEIVYDVAPNASLYLVNFNTDVEFGNAVNYVRSRGVDVVSCSIGWPPGGPGDGTGPIADVIQGAIGDGILWVNSAGNQANRHWMGVWSDSNGNGVHDFATGDEGNTFGVVAGQPIRVAMRWQDSWSTPVHSFRLELYDSTNTLIAAETAPVFPNSPTRYVETWGAGGGIYYIVIRRLDSNPGAPLLELFTYDQDLSEHHTPVSSVVPPADMEDVLSVGAVPYYSPNTLEPFSSHGPTLDGRIKPDLVAPDGVSTLAYSPDSFFGTSAACPHVAGAAALMWGYYTAYTSAQIGTLLKSSVVDLGTTGNDNLYGAGRLLLGAPPSGTPTTTPSLSPTASRTPTFTLTPGTPTDTPTVTLTPTQTRTPTPTASPTNSPTASDTPTLTATSTRTATSTPTATPFPTGWYRVALAGRTVRDLIIDPNNANEMLACTAENWGVYASHDGGGSWALDNIGLLDADVYLFAQEPTSPWTVYLASDQHLWKRTAGGPWTFLPVVGASYSWLSGLAVAPGLAGRLYLTGWDPCQQIQVSSDGGMTWVQRAAPDLCSLSPLDSILAVSASNGDRVYVARGHDLAEILRSDDAGQSWTSLTPIAGVVGINDMALSPFDDAHLVVGTYNQGVYRSIDAGLSWTSINNGLPGGGSGANVTALAMAPFHDDQLYAAVWGLGVYRLSHASGMWMPYGHGLPTAVVVYALRIAPARPGRLWAATSDGVWVIDRQQLLLPAILKNRLLGVTPTPTLPPYPGPSTTPTPTFSPTVTPTSWWQPTSTPTATSTVTATPDPCPDAIINGGFETRSAWTLSPSPYRAAYTDMTSHSGAWSLRQGIEPGLPIKASYSSAYQTVYIPPDATQVTLHFWWRRFTEEPPAYLVAEPEAPPGHPSLEALPYFEDMQEVLVLHSVYFTVLKILTRVRLNEGVFVEERFDLTEFA